MSITMRAKFHLLGMCEAPTTSDYALLLEKVEQPVLEAQNSDVENCKQSLFARSSHI